MSSTKSDINTLIAEKLMENTADFIPVYTHNTAAAFTVLAKLHSQGWFWRLDSVHDGVICTIQNLKRKTFSVGAPTASQAICECAVKTLEETSK